MPTPWSSSSIVGASAAEVKIASLLLFRYAKDEGDILGLRAMMFKVTTENELWDADTSFERVEGSFKTSPEVVLWVKKAIASVAPGVRPEDLAAHKRTSVHGAGMEQPCGVCLRGGGFGGAAWRP